MSAIHVTMSQGWKVGRCWGQGRLVGALGKGKGFSCLLLPGKGKVLGSRSTRLQRGSKEKEMHKASMSRQGTSSGESG